MTRYSTSKMQKRHFRESWPRIRDVRVGPRPRCYKARNMCSHQNSWSYCIIAPDNYSMKGTTFYQFPGTEICRGWIVEVDRCAENCLLRYTERLQGPQSNEYLTAKSYFWQRRNINWNSGVITCSYSVVGRGAQLRNTKAALEIESCAAYFREPSWGVWLSMVENSK